MLLIAQKIIPPAWMKTAETQAVMKALNDAAEPHALFVGGCVRNEIMKINVGDIDIATALQPEEVIARLKKAGIKVIPTGIDHGTVTAVSGKRSFEITTLRRDVETDGRHAKVAFTNDWAEDAARRDFTINTLLADADGNIYDPTGNGLRDIVAKKIIFVGDPAKRIAEDYLRIMRFFRFYAIYGEGNPDPAAIKACAQAADKISGLSRERITQEFLKILAVDQLAKILKLMFGNGILKDIAGKNYDPAVLGLLVRLQHEHDKVDVIARILVLSTDIKSLEKYLVFSNAQKKFFAAIEKALTEIKAGSQAEAKRLVYHHGNEAALQALLLHAAIHGQKPEGIKTAKNWQAPALPVNGEDMLAAGMTAGPKVGKVLNKIEEWWMDQDFVPDRAACLAQIKKLEG